jgi:hypothetical protein
MRSIRECREAWGSKLLALRWSSSQQIGLIQSPRLLQHGPGSFPSIYRVNPHFSAVAGSIAWSMSRGAFNKEEALQDALRHPSNQDLSV